MAGKFEMVDNFARTALNMGVGGRSRTLASHSRIQTRVGLALLAADFISLWLALAVTLALRVAIVGYSGLPNEGLTKFWDVLSVVLPIAGLLGCAWAMGHYTRRIPQASERRHLLGGAAVALWVGAGLLAAGARSDPMSVALGVWLIFPALALVLRALSRRLLDAAGLWRVRTLVVGHGEMALRSADALGAVEGLGYEVVSTISPWAFDANPDRFDWHGSMRKQRAQFVVISHIPGTSAHVPLVDSLVRERIPFAILKDRDDDDSSVSGHHVVRLDKRLELHLVRHSLGRPLVRAAKIALDLMLASFLLVFLMPVFLVIAILVKRDGGPAFYAHRRIGSNGRRFGCLKFRSMAVDADAVLDRVLRESPERAAEWEATQKLRDDPRVTRIGAFLRKTSLDEIPQLINVLRLEMSLVGPRPIVESEVRHYGRDIAFYLQVRPGVTGLWQISGRSDTSYAQRVTLDSTYVRSWSLLGDLVILAKTAPAVLARRGAH